MEKGGEQGDIIGKDDIMVSPVVVGWLGNMLLTTLSMYPVAVNTLRRCLSSVRHFDTWQTFSPASKALDDTFLTLGGDRTQS